MTQQTTERIIQATQLLELIHQAEEHYSNNEPNLQLKELINSALSILVLHLRNRSFRVTIRQAKVISMLQESVR